VTTDRAFETSGSALRAGDLGEPVEVTTYGYLCVGCPLGCRLEVDEDPAGDVVEVRGFSCRKGRTFALQEHTDPRRLVTTTVAVDGGVWPRLPVRTVEAVPKALMFEVCHALSAVRLHAPVALGDVVLADVCGTGVDVVATRDLPALLPD
jgi:CxxC motif-containing protein